MNAIVPDAITRYFDATGRGDVEAILAQFTKDAVVIDEDQTFEGIDRIREWRTKGPASAYTYTTEVIGTEQTGHDTFVSEVRIDGDFPGGTAALTFRFATSGDHINFLEIAP